MDGSIKTYFEIQVAYGALIISFLGAVHWGMAMTSTLGRITQIFQKAPVNTSSAVCELEFTLYTYWHVPLQYHTWMFILTKVFLPLFICTHHHSSSESTCCPEGALHLERLPVSCGLAGASDGTSTWELLHHTTSCETLWT